MKKIKSIVSIVSMASIVSMVSMMSVSCSDTWDDHYSDTAGASDKTLLQLIQENDNLSDFLSVLQATHLYNNNHSTRVTYADLLASDQSLTVWAPENGSFNCDSLLALCETEKGDSTVGLHFVGSHLAHTLYQSTLPTVTDTLGVKMYNDKYQKKDILTANIMAGTENTPALNGLLHVISKEIKYNYNIYEAITSRDDLTHLGQFVKSYEKQELNEDASIMSGIVDGQKVYSDSVMRKENILYRTFGYINREDSNYLALLPTKQLWEKVSTDVDTLFNYGSIDKADSVGRYWKHVLMMHDMFFNDNIQYHRQDSIMSVPFVRGDESDDNRYHVFYRPYDTGGIVAEENITERLSCSNGNIYFLKQWPYDDYRLFFRPIKTEAESESALHESNQCTLSRLTRANDSITVSEKRYLDIVPLKSTSNWDATFKVRNTLSGTYDICLVILPKTVYNIYSRDTKPNKFTASLSYTDQNGQWQQLDLPNPEDPKKGAYISSGTQVDTLKVGRFTFPVCNYDQDEPTVRLKVTCCIDAREVKTYSREMYLDYIYLKPVGKEDAQ